MVRSLSISYTSAYGWFFLLTCCVACNWYGGELLSLAIPYSDSSAFASAGYTDLVVNSSYIGGQVRQHGNLSFTRVYESGHEVPAYQPETAYALFTRALFNFDMATGNTSLLQNSNYSTTGPDSVYNITNERIKDPGSQCYVLDSAQCTAEQWESVVNGSALVRNWIVVDANTTSLFPDLTNGTGSGNQTSPSGTGTPTSSGGPGATSTGAAPSESSGAAARGFHGRGWTFGGVESGMASTIAIAVGVGMLSLLL